MSMIHDVYVGFLDLDGTEFVTKPLNRAELIKTLLAFHAIDPASITVGAETTDQGAQTLGFIKGDPVVLHRASARSG